jgi:hypothetical protein
MRGLCARSAIWFRPRPLHASMGEPYAPRIPDRHRIYAAEPQAGSAVPRRRLHHPHDRADVESIDGAQARRAVESSLPIGVIDASRWRDIPFTRDLSTLRTDRHQPARLEACFGGGGRLLGIATHAPELVPFPAREFRFKRKVWLAPHAAPDADSAAMTGLKPVYSGGGQGWSDVLYPRTLRTAKSRAKMATTRGGAVR